MTQAKLINVQVHQFFWACFHGRKKDKSIFLFGKRWAEKLDLLPELDNKILQLTPENQKRNKQLTNKK
jgi:hypothetical protein